MRRCRALLVDGQDVPAVSHMGRTLTARQKTALNERDRFCVVPGCNDDSSLEYDHTLDHHLGAGQLYNLGRLCQWHHYLKTHHRYRLRHYRVSGFGKAPTTCPPTPRPASRS